MDALSTARKRECGKRTLWYVYRNINLKSVCYLIVETESNRVAKKHYMFTYSRRFITKDCMCNEM